MRTDSLSPMMVKYLEFKERYPEAILFFQVGDFYELFFNDAVIVSRALNLTLTSRDKTQAEPIPMCGVPLSVVDSYVDRLVKLGHAIAVVSQIGNPKQGIDRVLDRIVTPGMRLFSSVDTDLSQSIIAAVSFDSLSGPVAVAFTEPQSGKIEVRDQVDCQELPRYLSILSPKEIVLPQSVKGEKIDRRLSIIRLIERNLSSTPIRFRNEEDTQERTLSNVPGFTAVHPLSKRAVKLLVRYVDEVSVGASIPFRAIESSTSVEHMSIDGATRRNLELVSNLKDGSDHGTLYRYLNETVTAGGGRLLRKWILNPLLSIPQIEERQSAVAYLKDNNGQIKCLLAGIPDLERLAARIELNIASPRDLGAIRDTCKKIPEIIEVLNEVEGIILLSKIEKDLHIPSELSELLSAIVEEPPPSANEGGIFNNGFNSDLDKILHLRHSAGSCLSEYELKEREATGINNLKVKNNNIIGYFIEMPTSQSSKAPDRYIRRQSVASADRFTTLELKKLESDVVGAIGQQINLERKLFEELRGSVAAHIPVIRSIAEAISKLDVLESLAVVASKYDLALPVLSEEAILDIKNGKHPIIATRLEGEFVPNSILFGTDCNRFYLVTGPNMGGKSTFLRQAALIVIMTQIGSYVPAESAVVGIVDKVFARIGASDDIHEGDSTFMVEMREAAYILSNATKRSLVLIDELGRGTATSDGLALARAILEDLTNRCGARTLFATHFHELTSITDSLKGVGNLSVGSKEEEDQVIFTHAICEGPAPRSYGIEVAKLSGLSSEVIERATVLLSTSEEEQPKKVYKLNLFERPKREKITPPELERLSAKISEIKPDELTPRHALDLIYELKAILGNSSDRQAS